MSTTTKAPAVSTIALADLIVKDGFNPRGEIDKDSVKDLISSIKQDGLLQPVLARREGDTVTLIAGHRRVYAAGKAGLKEVPVLIRDNITEEEAAALAFDENEQRESMVPMARGIALKNQFKKLGSYKKVGARRSMNAQQVSALIKMTELPDSVQEIAMKHREFGPDLAKTLVVVASKPGGEAVAVMLANEAMESDETERLVRTKTDRVLDKLVNWRDEQETDEARNTVPFATGIHGLNPTDVFDDAEKAEDLKNRAIAAKKVLQWSCRTISVYGLESWENGEPRVSVTLDDASVDRLKASGVLFAISYTRGEDWSDDHHYVFDVEAIRTEVEQTIESAEKEAKAELKRQEKEAKKAQEKKAEDPAAIDEDGEVKSDRQMQKEAAEKARSHNEAIGQALLARGNKKVTKKTTLEMTRLMALVFVRQAEGFAALGMRLCFASWKEVEVKELKSGEKREKVHYLDPSEAKDRLIKSIEAAKSVEAIHLILSDAIVAATFSNEDELPMSKRVNQYGYHSERISKVTRPDREFIDSLAKGVLPEEVEAQRLESIEKGYDDPYAISHTPDPVEDDEPYDDEADLEEEVEEGGDE